MTREKINQDLENVLTKTSSAVTDLLSAIEEAVRNTKNHDIRFRFSISERSFMRLYADGTTMYGVTDRGEHIEADDFDWSSIFELAYAITINEYYEG